MKRPSLALATLAIALAAAALTAASPAWADYAIIRWSSGDCRIWDNAGPFATPLGVGWSLLANELPTYDVARVALEDMYRQGLCR
jgi:hypothetical protein